MSFKIGIFFVLMLVSMFLLRLLIIIPCFTICSTIYLCVYQFVDVIESFMPGRYVAPEVYRNEEYDTKVDVFSFALILQEVIYVSLAF